MEAVGGVARQIMPPRRSVCRRNTRPMVPVCCPGENPHCSGRSANQNSAAPRDWQQNEAFVSSATAETSADYVTD